MDGECDTSSVPSCVHGPVQHRLTCSLCVQDLSPLAMQSPSLPRVAGYYYLQAQLSLTVKKGGRLCLGAILGVNCSFGALVGPLGSVS